MIDLNNFITKTKPNGIVYKLYACICNNCNILISYKQKSITTPLLCKKCACKQKKQDYLNNPDMYIEKSYNRYHSKKEVICG